MADSDPLVTLEPGGKPAILSYNVPDPTSYPGRFNLGIAFGFIDDQQAIFRPMVAQAVAPPSLVGERTAPSVNLRKSDGGDDGGDGGGGGGGGGGGTIEVHNPSVFLDLPTAISTVGPPSNIVLTAVHDGDTHDIDNLVFVVRQASGAEQRIDGGRDASDPDTWRGAWQPATSGRYRVSIEGGWTDAKHNALTWRSTLAKDVDLTLTAGAGPGGGAKQPPQVSFDLASPGPFALDVRGQAVVSFIERVTDPDGAGTRHFLDGQLDQAPKVEVQPDGTVRYSVTVTSTGQHTVRVEAQNPSRLVTTRDVSFQVNAAAAVPLRQHLVLIFCTQLSNFLGSYGAGRTIQTFSLLPGEKTKISIKTYQSNTTTATQAQSIMDGFDETTQSEFQDAVSAETGTKANDSSQFAAAAKAEASGSWGFASAKVDVSVSGSSASALEQFSKNVDNAVRKHTASKSARRQAQVNYSSTATSTSGTESDIERTIENINVSRTLNFVFRQLNQEFISLLHLTDIRLAHVYGAPDLNVPWQVREVPLAEMGSLLGNVLLPDYVDAAQAVLLAQIDVVTDQHGTVTPLLEEVACMRPKRNASGDLVYDTTDPRNPVLQTEPDGSHYLRFRPRVQTYSDTSGNVFTVPGVILRAAKNTLRSDGVIVEALLGQANALDNYSSELQAQTVRQRKLQNQRLLADIAREQLAHDVILGVEPAQRPDAFAKVYPPPPDTATGN